MLEIQKNLANWRGVRPPEPVVLAGRWAELEPLSAAKHADSLWQALHGHDQVWEWMADGPYATEADFAAAIAAKEAGESVQFFAILPSSASGEAGWAVGYASLMRIDAANGAVEVGNVMFSPILQRTPVATDAMYLMAKYVFDDLGYRRYEWKCNSLNLPSRKAAARFGFTYEGTFRQHLVVKGRNRDTAWFSMLDIEWPARKRAFESWLAADNFDEQGQQIRTLGSITASL